MIKNFLNKFFNFFKKTPSFSIEYYPSLNRYYPKCNKSYFKMDCRTNVLVPLESFLFQFASFALTEEQAEDMISRFKEHHLKMNIVVIQK